MSSTEGKILRKDKVIVSNELRIGQKYDIKQEDRHGKKLRVISTEYYGKDPDGWHCFYDKEDINIIRLDPNHMAYTDVDESEYSIDEGNVGFFMDYKVIEQHGNVKVVVDIPYSHYHVAEQVVDYEGIARNIIAKCTPIKP